MKLSDYNIPIRQQENPLACYNELYPYKKGCAELAPGICRRLLGATNNSRVVTELLELIDKRLSQQPGEYINWRPVLLNIVTNRKQPQKIAYKINSLQLQYLAHTPPSVEDFALGKLLAEQMNVEMPPKIMALATWIPENEANSVCREIALLEIQQQQSEILLSANAKAQASPDEIYIGRSNINGTVDDTDFSHFKAAKFSEETGIFNLKRCQNFPQANNLAELEKLRYFSLEETDYCQNVLRLPNCVTGISLQKASGFSPNVDFSNTINLTRFWIENSDFTGVNGIFLPELAELDSLLIKKAKALPADFDLSVLKKVAYADMDLSYLLKPNARLPRNICKMVIKEKQVPQCALDLSSCSKVSELVFENSNLSQIKTIKFPAVIRELVFTDCELPEVLNLNINGLQNIKFQNSNQNGNLQHLVFPEDMRGKKISLPLNSNRVKIYYGSKRVPLMAEMFNKMRTKLFR